MKKRTPINRLRLLLVLSALVLSLPFLAYGQGEPFYKGKTIKFVVGSGAGAFYDLWGRLIARHWG